MSPDPTTSSTAPDEVSPYDGLLDHDLPLEGQGDAHWAFGTDFEDPLAGVDTTVPSDVDPGDLAAYCLMLGDDALVLSQRLAEWCSRGPDLEDDIALANVALDLLGQARLLLARAAAADPTVVPALPEGSPVPAEDALAFFRDDRGFRNVRLAEVANGDFARTVVRLLLASTVRLALLTRLRGSRDPVLAAIAAKGVKELTYHRDWSARWVVTLARGTDESRARTRAGLAAVWPFLDETLRSHPVEQRVAAAGVGVDPAEVRAEVEGVLEEVLRAAGLERPHGPCVGAVSGGRAGRDGLHTEALGRMLAEMQVVARAHPTGVW
ncbi:phenylacetate-CoA oxygenase subunit PaaC [Nocardioides sp. HDW12B]|uniref:1,2-phenylacetyl-CoA epoxidase subunit PaaC n=1 Tax=Nocardioides sp. HDW12B TaxID=2714939 RepID=UPI00140E0054|nr:1,2-phenylacetyl-CoA epoxidase subunit PaaC [Nocardioides sp. HDW12B]QIK67209.1 phenylacetate-CoA oxygenase subunit PaaC [Nocardioides sp. HDW12B]